MSSTLQANIDGDEETTSKELLANFIDQTGRFNPQNPQTHSLTTQQMQVQSWRSNREHIGPPYDVVLSTNHKINVDIIIKAQDKSAD